jgi:hypothetical protein
MALKYYQDVFDSHMVKRLPKLKVSNLEIGEEWLEKLTAHEVAPSK